MKVQDWIALNAEKQKLLTKENEKVYGDILIYMRMSSAAEEEVEPLLVEILDHLLDAQANGKSAHDVFGNDPKVFCDEMLATISKRGTKELLSTMIPAAVLGIGMYILTTMKGSIELSYISLIGAPLALLVWVGSILYGMRASSFKGKKGLIIFCASFIFANVFVIGVFLLEKFYGNPIFVLRGMPFYAILCFIALVMMVVDYRLFGVKGVFVIGLFLAGNLVTELQGVSKNVIGILAVAANLGATALLLTVSQRKKQTV